MIIITPNNNYYAPFGECALIFNTTVSPFQTSTAPLFPSQLFPPCRHRHYASVSRRLLLLFRVTPPGGGRITQLTTISPSLLNPTTFPVVFRSKFTENPMVFWGVFYFFGNKWFCLIPFSVIRTPSLNPNTVTTLMFSSRASTSSFSSSSSSACMLRKYILE